MDLPVYYQGKEVGCCCVQEQGLYWYIDCQCRRISDRVLRLYCGGVRLGVLEREGDMLTLRRRISKSTMPDLHGTLLLAPSIQPWQGEILGYQLSGGLSQEKQLLFPYDPEGPCPCPPLFCFFRIEAGYWLLELDDQGEPVFS